MKFYNTNFLWGCIESDHPGAPRVRGGQESDLSSPDYQGDARGIEICATSH